MAREVAEVMLGGRVVGYAVIDVDLARSRAELGSAVLLGHPTRSATAGSKEQPCSCPPESLAFAKVKSRRGDAWSLPVRLCATHCRLRLA